MKIIIKKQDGGIKLRDKISIIVNKISCGYVEDNGDLIINIMNGNAEDLIKLTDAGIPFMVVVENRKKPKKKNYEIFFLLLAVIIGLILALTSPYLVNENKFVSIGGGALNLTFSTLFFTIAKLKFPDRPRYCSTHAVYSLP